MMLKYFKTPLEESVQASVIFCHIKKEMYNKEYLCPWEIKWAT